MKFFISYTTRDNEVTIELLKSISIELRKIGQVFIDIIDNDSLDKQKRVISELDSSDILILLKTKSSFESKWVLFELGRATQNKTPVKIITVTENTSFRCPIF